MVYMPVALASESGPDFVGFVWRVVVFIVAAAAVFTVVFLVVLAVVMGVATLIRRIHGRTNSSSR
jgi:hypothetical protein